MQIDDYYFSEKPQFDGSKPLMKNGIETACPKSQPFGVQHEISGQIELRRMSCNDRCPFVQTAQKTEKDNPENKTDGVVIMCMERPMFVRILAQQKSSLKLIK